MGAGASANKATGSGLSLPRQRQLDTPTASSAAPASGRLGGGGGNVDSFVHSARSTASGSDTRSEGTTNRRLGLSPGASDSSSLSTSPVSLLDDDGSSMSSLQPSDGGRGGPAPPLTPSQQDKLRRCLTSLESHLDVSFSVETMLPHVEAVACEPSGEIVTRGTPAGGLFVIDEGVVEVVFAQGGGSSTVLHSLLPGECVGELGSLFGVACSATARPKQRVTLLRVPAGVVQRSVTGELTREKMLSWCIKKSYVDTANILALEYKALALLITASCIKASFLSMCSEEPIEYLASLTDPMLFTAGEVLFSQGEESSHVFFILHGGVECLASTRSKRWVKFSDQGYAVGKEGLLSHRRREYTARAISPLLVAPITVDMIQEMALQYPSESFKLKELLNAH